MTRPACARGFVVFAVLTLVVVETNGPAGRAAADETLHFVPSWPLDMQHIRLELDIQLEKRHVDATATLTLTGLEPTRSVTLDAVDFQTHEVRVAYGDEQPQPAAFADDGQQIEVFFDRVVKPGQTVRIVVRYSLDDPKAGLHFFSPERDGPDAPYQLWTQGESIFHRHWIPCFDHPAEMQTTELIATVDRKYTVLSNGVLVEKKALPDGRVRYHWRQEQPHVVYLVTLVVGEFAIVEDTWRGRPVLYYVPPDKADQARTTFGRTLRMLDFFSDIIGVEYPWPKYAQVACYNFGGGMENTSATTVGERALVDEKARLDGDSDSLIAHELAHQWFGDLLTCREWAHIWLNESFASYYQALWFEHDRGADAFAYDMWGKSRGARHGDVKHPIVWRGYGHPREQFDSRAYPKGAWVLHMLRRRLGDERFFKAIGHYVRTHRHQTVETSDLRRAVEEATHTSQDRFFYDWVYRPGHPKLSVRFDWDDDQKLASVQIEQTQKADPYLLTTVVEFVGDDGSVTRLEREMTGRRVTLSARLEARPKLVRFDPDMQVLADLELKLPRDLLIAMLREDDNALSRLRALKALAGSKTEPVRKALAEALRSERFWGVRREIAGRLGDLGGETARDALLAGLADKDARVRAACIRALEHWPDDEQVATAVAEKLADADESYGVQAAAARTYAKLNVDDAYEKLRPLLKRDSRNDQIRVAVLESLGQLDDKRAVRLLARWIRDDKPSRLRIAAASAIGDLAEHMELDEDVIDQAVEALTAAVQTAGRRLPITAARVLGKFGRRAVSALPVLRRVARGGPEERVREAARKAIDAIVKDRPPTGQIDELRERIKELEQRIDTLQDELESLEAINKALRQVGHDDDDDD